MLGFPICTDSRTNSLFLYLELVCLHPFAACIEIDIVTGAATRSLCLESEKSVGDRGPCDEVAGVGRWLELGAWWYISAKLPTTGLVIRNRDHLGVLTNSSCDFAITIIKNQNIVF